MTIAHGIQLGERRLFHAPHDVGHAPGLQGGTQSAAQDCPPLASSAAGALEIVLMIISVLSLCDAGCVRSTCRALATSTYAVWVRIKFHHPSLS
jgi:hypothetical protein